MSSCQHRKSLKLCSNFQELLPTPRFLKPTPIWILSIRIEKQRFCLDLLIQMREKKCFYPV
jgi:hypothetical protein